MFKVHAVPNTALKGGILWGRASCPSGVASHRPTLQDFELCERALAAFPAHPARSVNATFCHFTTAREHQGAISVTDPRAGEFLRGDCGRSHEYRMHGNALPDFKPGLTGLPNNQGQILLHRSLAPAPPSVHFSFPWVYPPHSALPWQAESQHNQYS